MFLLFIFIFFLLFFLLFFHLLVRGVDMFLSLWGCIKEAWSEKKTGLGRIGKLFRVIFESAEVYGYAVARLVSKWPLKRS